MKDQDYGLADLSSIGSQDLSSIGLTDQDLSGITDRQIDGFKQHRILERFVYMYIARQQAEDHTY